MGKITIESASANGKDRRTHVISSELSIKSKQFKLCFNISLFPLRDVSTASCLFSVEEVEM